MEPFFFLGMFFGFIAGIFFSCIISKMVYNNVLNAMNDCLKNKKKKKEDREPADWWKPRNWHPKD